ncbi:phage tail tube protein [Falsirhodobacter sp. 20TX0035]|uniref:phage tail tube protein n=1 Tax=Falsirhodobacter sp. 20TX0035 TaxID=3022019 RepID=UPI00232E101C|nr:phage tail tube protein [Falsirhodobacter sp. 20TX0035]MDB6455026.1 phage tail tube protein [Falsirhodobacter sp. 20TX0035]
MPPRAFPGNDQPAPQLETNDMAIPELSYRGDVVVMAALNPAAPATFTNFCGATGITLAIENSVTEETVGDCDDWSLPSKVVVAYGAQNVTMTINAQFAKSNRDKLIRWAADQLLIPLRLHMVDAAAGEVEYIDGIGMLPSFNIDGIGNTTGAALTSTLNIRFKEGVEFTNAA